MITEALQAFIWILKFPLPAVEQNAEQLTKQLFVLLNDYAKAGAGHGENFHLVQNCFKVPKPADMHMFLIKLILFYIHLTQSGLLCVLSCFCLVCFCLIGYNCSSEECGEKLHL